MVTIQSLVTSGIVQQGDHETFTHERLAQIEAAAIELLNRTANSLEFSGEEELLIREYRFLTDGAQHHKQNATRYRLADPSFHAFLQMIINNADIG